MQTTTRINTPVLTELAQPSNALTLSDLNNPEHPVNIKALSGKRIGMGCLINELLYMAQGNNPSDLWREVGYHALHFGAYSQESFTLSTDATAPSYLTELTLAGTSSEGFGLIPAYGGIKNVSGRNIPAMVGSITLQAAQGAGLGDMHFWSESSFDEGLSWIPNEFSLRTEEIKNNQATSTTKTSATDLWVPNQIIRWAMYNAGAGTVVLASPSDVVNTGQAISGFSWFFALQEV